MEKHLKSCSNLDLGLSVLSQTYSSYSVYRHTNRNTYTNTQTDGQTDRQTVTITSSIYDSGIPNINRLFIPKVSGL